MGHLSLSEIAVQFVNTEIIARCYNHIFTWRGYTARFQEEVDQSEALLKTCQPGEWMQTFSRLRKRGDLKAMQEFLKEDFLRQVQLMTNACRQLRERRKVLDIFQSDAFALFVFFSAGGNAQCVLCCGVRGVGFVSGQRV